jgi:hypothetical protein
MTVNNRMTKLFLRRQEQSYVPHTHNLKLQILPSISEPPQCQKHHIAAFTHDAAIVIVWDDPKHILERARRLEQQLLKMIRKRQSAFGEKKSEQVEDSAQTPGDSCGEEPSEGAIDKPRKTILLKAASGGFRLKS